MITAHLVSWYLNFYQLNQFDYLIILQFSSNNCLCRQISCCSEKSAIVMLCVLFCRKIFVNHFSPISIVIRIEHSRWIWKWWEILYQFNVNSSKSPYIFTPGLLSKPKLFQSTWSNTLLNSTIVRVFLRLCVLTFYRFEWKRGTIWEDIERYLYEQTYSAYSHFCNLIPK